MNLKLAYIYLAQSNSTITTDGLVQNMYVIVAIMIAQYIVFTLLTIFIDTYKFKQFIKTKPKFNNINQNLNNYDLNKESSSGEYLLSFR